VLDASASLTLNNFEEYQAENITKRFQVILDDINDFFDHKNITTQYQELNKTRIAKLLTQRIFSKLREIFSKN